MSVKAGAFSGVLVGLVFAVFLTVTVMGNIESLLSSNPILASNRAMTFQTILLVFGVFAVLILVALSSFFGAIAGFIFVKAVNKLPFRSTYLKAVLPWGILSIWSTVLGPLIYPRSLSREISSVGLDTLLVVGALLFAYLFNRWQTINLHPQVSSDPAQGSESKVKTNG